MYARLLQAHNVMEPAVAAAAARRLRLDAIWCRVRRPLPRCRPPSLALGPPPSFYIFLYMRLYGVG